MRGIKRMYARIFKGYHLYHNYFREHDTFGKTPAEAANIKIEGQNKIMTVIQNACMKSK
jgi:hypothetical protein